MSLNFKKHWQLFKPLFGSGFKSLLIYKWAIIVSLLVSGVFLIFQIELFTALHNSSPETLDLNYLISYFILIQWLRLFLPSGVNQRLANEVRTGDIAYTLLRPVALEKIILAESFGKNCFKAFVMGFPFYSLLIYRLFSASFDGARSVWFLIFCIFAYLFQFYFEMILGILAFYLLNTWGIDSFKEAMLIVFSGQLLPISLYPAWLQGFIKMLPFRLIYDMPISILLDKNLENVGAGLLFAAFWLLLTRLLYRFVYQKVLSQIVIQGG